MRSLRGCDGRVDLFRGSLAFQQAAAESPVEGRLIRLTRKDDWVLPTVFSEEKLQFIADNDIEVR